MMMKYLEKGLTFILMPKVTFAKKDNEFYSELKNRVEEYFQQKNTSKHGDMRLYTKAIVLYSILIGAFITLLTKSPDLPWYINVLLCVIIGWTKAGIGFNVMHDACHESYSKNGNLNYILGYSLNVLGSVCFFWKQKHNIIHHTYTNVDGVDDDIAKGPFLRHCYEQQWYPHHKFQHIYLPLAYAISSIHWVFVMDFQKYFTGKINTTDRWEMDGKEKAIFWGSKLYYVLTWIVLPIALLGFKPWIIGFLCMHVALGFTLAIVFQLAHVVENAHFVGVTGDAHIEENWAKHQIATTANFARQNKIVNWYVGGLNFQVEHHLFPRVSHIHYPEISKIVKATCEEYGLFYNEFPTMFSAVKSHFKMMKEFGQNQVPQVA
jgi:linoleoyl-CoA desaturase